MRIKTFTLMLLALFVSTLSFAQKNIAPFNKQMLAQRPSMVQKGLQISGQQLMKTSTAAPKFAPVRRAEPVTPPSGGDVLYYTLSGDNSRMSGVERTVKVIFDGNDVYISGLSYFIPDGFVKGTFGEGNTITFSAMQYVGDYSFSDGDASMFMAGTTTGKDQLDFTATLSDDETVFTFPSIVGEFYQIGEESGLTAYWYPDATLTLIEGDVDLPIEPPLDLVTEMYSLSATDEIYSSSVSRLVNVGFYGDEVYLQGISADLPDAWIKGTIDNNVVTFKTGQLLGAYSSTYNLWFLGWDWTNNCPIDVQFTYDAVNQKFTAEEFLISLKKDDYRNACFEVNGDITISKVVEKPGTPANPAVLNMQFTPKGDLLDISINVSDVEGNGMLPEKLFYKFYSKDAQGATKELTFSKDVYTTLESDLTEIPYELATKEISNTLVSLLMDHSDWTEIGLQSIYKGGGESHESEIAWYTINWPVQITLPEGLTIKEHVFKGTTYSSGSDVPFTSSLNMAIDGNDLYIQGFGADAGVADTWVKGTKNDDGIYVFKAGQDLGSASGFRLFFLGYSDEGEVEDFKLSVDTQNGVYQFLNTALLNVFYTDKSYYYTMFNSDCTISTEGSGAVTPPAGLETQDAFMAGYLNTGSAVVTKQNVKIGRDGNDVYVQGIFRTMPEAWAKGTFKDESTITFEPQLIAMTPDYTMYYLLGSDDGETIVPLNFSYKTTKKGEIVVEQVSPTFYSVSTSKNELNVTYYGYNVGIHTMKATETVPDQLTTEKYSLTYEDADKAQAAKIIEFGILDNKAYLKGISADAPNAWLVGDVEGASIKFETPQALANDGSVVFLNYDAANNKTMPYFELTWDATAKTLASVGDYVAIVNNSLITRPYYLEMMTHMNAKVFADVAATPADPEFENMHFTYYGDYIGFTVKTISTTGEGLLPEKLYYKMYSKDEADQVNPIVFTTDKYEKLSTDMTEIPYGFEDAEGGYDFYADHVYLMMNERLTWKQIGIQAIYKGGDAVNASNIVWYTIVQPTVAVLPDGAEVTEHVISGTMSSGATSTVVIPANTKVKMAKVDNSIYIQGLQGEAWVRGNLTAENTYTFANGQLLGEYVAPSTNTFLLFLLGTDADKNVVNSTIQLNTTTNKYEFMTNVVVNATYTDRLWPLLQYDKGCTIDVVETGISTVKADAQFNANAPAYNMAGQRVDKDFKGLVIKGGKKFVIK